MASLVKGVVYDRVTAMTLNGLRTGLCPELIQSRAQTEYGPELLVYMQRSVDTLGRSVLQEAAGNNLFYLADRRALVGTDPVRDQYVECIPKDEVHHHFGRAAFLRTTLENQEGKGWFGVGSGLINPL